MKVFENCSLVIVFLMLYYSVLLRIAIVDWDIHHGNGIQRVFERDPE